MRQAWGAGAGEWGCHRQCMSLERTLQAVTGGHVPRACSGARMGQVNSHKSVRGLRVGGWLVGPLVGVSAERSGVELMGGAPALAAQRL